MTVIITSGESRQSLCSVRALGRSNITVVVGYKKYPNLSSYSRYASSSFLLEDPYVDPYAFTKSLSNEIKSRYALCALVDNEDAFYALSTYRELLPINMRRILPPHISVVRSIDYEALYHFAESIGISCVDLLSITPPSNKDDIDNINLAFPLLVIPNTLWFTKQINPVMKSRPIVLYQKAQLRQFLAKLSFACFITSYDSQKIISYFGVAKAGEVLAYGMQQEVRTSYLDIKKSLTIDPLPHIKHDGQKLLKALQWQGPFFITFSGDNTAYKLLSLQGFLWESLELAIKAELNIPLISYHLAEGTLGIDKILTAKHNIALHYLWPYNSISSSIFKTFKKGISLLGFNAKEDITNYYSFIDIDDPLPFLWAMKHGVPKWFK